jgi:hypothetical protein
VAALLENRADRKRQSGVEGFVSGDYQIAHLVIPGCASLGADPESRTEHCSGFRVRAEEARPGMTEHTIHLVIPGCALLGADPESRTEHISGFRVRAEDARPGMTEHTIHLVIPGCALLGADPESSTVHCSGFRVRAVGPRLAPTASAPRNDGEHSSSRHSGMRLLRRRPGIQHRAHLWIPGSHRRPAPCADRQRAPE